MPLTRALSELSVDELKQIKDVLKNGNTSAPAPPVPTGESLQDVRIACERLLDKMGNEARGYKNDMATILRRAHDAGERRGIAKGGGNAGAPLPPVDDEPPAKPVVWNEARQMFFTMSAAGRMCSHDGVEWRLVDQSTELPKSPPRVAPPAAVELRNTGAQAAGVCCKGGAKSFGKCRGCHGC